MIILRKSVTIVLIVILTGIIVYLNISLAGIVKSMGGQAQAVQHVSRDKLRLAFIFTNHNNRFWEMVKRGARDAAAEKDVYLRFFESNERSQLQTADNLQWVLITGYDGIIIHTEDEQVVPLIRRAGDRRIPVIVVGSDLPASGRVSYVGINNYRDGFAAGKAILRAMPPDSDAYFGILSAAADSDRQLSVAESLKVFGFREAVSSAPRASVVVWRKCEMTRLETVNQVREMLEAHPELTGIYSTHAQGTIAAAQVVKEKGLVGRIKVAGFGDSPEIRQLIKEGVIAATIAEYPYQIGMTAVKEMLLYLREGRVNVFNNIGGVVLTQENLAEYEKQGGFFHGEEAPGW